MNFDVWGSGIVYFLNNGSENNTRQGTLGIDRIANRTQVLKESHTIHAHTRTRGYIPVGGKFRDFWINHENNENWHPTEITRYTVYSGMQEWVIQIPSIPILVSVLFPSLHLKY